MNKKIVLFIPSLNIGGTEKVFSLLASAFQKNNFLVDIIFCGNERNELLSTIPDGVNVISTGSPKLRRSLIFLSKYLYKVQPDFALSGLSHSNVILILASIISRSKTKVFISEHSLLSYRLEAAGSLKERLVLFLAKYLYSYSNGIISVSKEIKNEIVSFLKISADKIVIINNPIDISKIRYLSQLPISHPWLKEKEFPVILSVGRLVTEKDYPTLLRSMDIILKNQKVRLIIIGDGEDEYKSYLIKLADELGILNYVDFIGYEINPYNFMKNSDVFVLSSKTEGFGLVLIEALACDLPIVATNTTGAKEVLRNGGLGVIVPVGDEIKMASAITNFSQNRNVELFYQNYIQEFDINNIAKKYLKFFYSHV